MSTVDTELRKVRLNQASCVKCGGTGSTRYCRPCQTAYMREWRVRNSESFKPKRNEYQRRWSARNKEKTTAHYLLSKAVGRGDIIRQPCEVCGELDTHGHHDDYTKPLDVRWLCYVHHALAHRALRGNA